jgi:hypothetical protein
MGKIKKYDTNKSVKLPICIFYNQKISLGSSGTLSLRKGSRTGEIIESFDVTSDKISISARELFVYPTNPLPYETNVHVTVSDKFVVSSMNGSGFTGLEEDGTEEFYFNTESPYGKPLEGGIVVAKDEGGYYWVVSLQSTEINGSWNEISNIIAKVSNETGTTGWILPTKNIIQNQLSTNKNYWIDQNSQDNLYWVNDEIDFNHAYYINVNQGISYFDNKKSFHKIRLFKKVIY